MKFQKFLIFHLWVCVTDSPRCLQHTHYAQHSSTLKFLATSQLLKSVFKRLKDHLSRYCLYLARPTRHLYMIRYRTIVNIQSSQNTAAINSQVTNAPV